MAVLSTRGAGRAWAPEMTTVTPPSAAVASISVLTSSSCSALTFTPTSCAFLMVSIMLPMPPPPPPPSLLAPPPPKSMRGAATARGLCAESTSGLGTATKLCEAGRSRLQMAEIIGAVDRARMKKEISSTHFILIKISPRVLIFTCVPKRHALRAQAAPRGCSRGGGGGRALAPLE